METNVKSYKATIVGLEEAQSFGNVLYLSLSNIEEKGEDNKFVSVNGFPQINKDGELTILKGIQVSLGDDLHSSVGKALAGQDDGSSLSL